ncbi:MAG: DUF2330 domain-containing protein [Chloroflexales bacterium]|nr:DUF2330 domain-containing protein [Chloroflexales bacterium]
MLLRRPLYHLSLFGFLLSILLFPPAVSACGLPFQASIAAEQALIVYAEGRQQIVTAVQLADITGQAAIVFPVPSAPEVDQPPGGEELFAYLDEATRPIERVVSRVVWDSGATEGAAPTSAVDVLGREIIGGYDVARLAANDTQALDRWLDANGYELPAGASAILDAYVAEGWKFVAIKLADQTVATGALAPLRMSFATDTIVYPIRLGALSAQPLAVDLYVLSRGRITIDRLETTYAGPVDQLDPAPPAALASLLSGAPYLTRLRAFALDPSSLTTDFVARSAPDNEPYRAVETTYTEIRPAESYGILLALCCLSLVSLFSISMGFAFKRHFDAISPEPD